MTWWEKWLATFVPIAAVMSYVFFKLYRAWWAMYGDWYEKNFGEK